MNDEVKKIYIAYSQLYKNHASEYADYLGGPVNQDFCSLLKSEYKKELKEVVKRERERFKMESDLLKLKLKADRRILRKRKVKVELDFKKTFSELFKACLDEYFADLFSHQTGSEEQQTAEEVDNDGTDVPKEAAEELDGATLQQAESDQAEPESGEDDFIPCEKCPHCNKDENDEYYCNRYEEELDPDTVADVRQCEQ